MLRASAAAEEAGVPSVSLTCEGFIGQAATTATGLGLPGLSVAVVPGHVDVQTVDELHANVLGVTVDGERQREASDDVVQRLQAAGRESESECPCAYQCELSIVARFATLRPDPQAAATADPSVRASAR